MTVKYPYMVVKCLLGYQNGVGVNKTTVPTQEAAVMCSSYQLELTLAPPHLAL